MQGKPYHKMPVSSWMRGNRDQKRKLIQAKKYPMKSAIQKNLSGPLSEIFFSNLTPVQQDHVGYTPKLQGPGEDLWVSPSDNLMGLVILKPPYTTKIKQSLTHRGILELGAGIEEKIVRAHEIEMVAAVRHKEQEMKKLAELLIKQAIESDRQGQAIMMNRAMEKAQKDLSSTYQAILTSTVDEIMSDSVQRMEEAVLHTRRQLERELCCAVESHRQYLGRQYELQVSWVHNQLVEKYENIVKKHGQKCEKEMERIRKECMFDVKRNFAHIQAEHITDLVVQACEKSHLHHEEKKNLENNFGNWFVTNYEAEIMNRDFTILELEDVIRQLEAQSQRREQQLKDVFKHFQKFINYALHEKPGQAEFLLSLQTELRLLNDQVKSEGEVEFIAKMIIDYILKSISVKATEEAEKESEEELNLDNFRDKISIQRSLKRLLTLVGEEKSNHHPGGDSRDDATEKEFKNNRLRSLLDLFHRNPSAAKMIHSLGHLPIIEQHFPNTK